MRSGMIGGGFLAVIVWFINSQHGALAATTAAANYLALLGAE